MPQFCDVALPLLLDTTFTYKLDGFGPAVGGRVLVPFRNQRLSGIVVSVHDKAPSVAAKSILQVLDAPAEPALICELMRLAEWMAHYYLAPLGEVFRSMLPLSAEFRKARGFQITAAGREALHQSAEAGSSRRSRKTADAQMIEYAVLNYLADCEMAREEALRAATGAHKKVFADLLRKKWIGRIDLSAARDSAKKIRIAVLKEFGGKLNGNQIRVLETLAALGGRCPVEKLRGLEIPKTTLQTLVKRGLVEITEEPAGSKPVERKIGKAKSVLAKENSFNAAQQQALQQIEASVGTGNFSVSLLHGVTGSGKTAVYHAVMQRVLDSGRSAIMLVPEIGLTPAAVAKMNEIFGEQVAVLHSALSHDDRAQQWHRIRRGQARLVVGTRSAVFAPVGNLALIVVDEEQDTSYKQEETPRYNARDVAVMRAKLTGAAVVLGSATPSLESYYNAHSGKYVLIELPDRVEQRPLPAVEIVDMRAEFQESGREQVISRKLLEEIGQRLQRGEQAMVLLNRRGYSALILCRECGEAVQCRHCAVSLTHHKQKRRMECHYCGYAQPVPQRCPKCGSEFLYFLGTGSEKLEEVLHQAFPQSRIGRLDRDTVRGRHDFERVLSSLDAGELDILVGTQMIAKGHDVHGVTLVGVVGADAALAFPDFRAAERTFQLLTQVAGRAGRGETSGKVILQTFFPDHYAVQFAAQHNYSGFYEKELRYRSWMHYPPFTSVANVLVRSNKLEEALKFSAILGKWFERTRHEGIRILGPAAAPIVKIKRDYRYHFILKSPSRKKLNSMLRAMLEHADGQKIPRPQVIVDVDAVSLL